MSHSESIKTVEENVGEPMKHMIYRGGQWVQQTFEDNVRKIVQQAPQKMVDRENPNVQFFTETIPQCEVCLPTRSMIIWVVIIAIVSIILWHLLFATIEWILEFCNRTDRTQAQWPPEYNDPRRMNEHSQKSDRNSYDNRWNNQDNERRIQTPPNNYNNAGY